MNLKRQYMDSMQGGFYGQVREKRGKLYLDIYIGGKRAWESLP
jgi:hypothetical protein